MLAPMVMETFCQPRSPKEAAEFMVLPTTTDTGCFAAHNLFGRLMACWLNANSILILMNEKHKKHYRCDGYSLLVLEKRCASSDGYEVSFLVAANNFTEKH